MQYPLNQSLFVRCTMVQMEFRFILGLYVIKYFLNNKMYQLRKLTDFFTRCPLNIALFTIYQSCKKLLCLVFRSMPLLDFSNARLQNNHYIKRPWELGPMSNHCSSWISLQCMVSLRFNGLPCNQCIWMS